MVVVGEGGGVVVVRILVVGEDGGVVVVRILVVGEDGLEWRGGEVERRLRWFRRVSLLRSCELGY